MKAKKKYKMSIIFQKPTLTLKIFKDNKTSNSIKAIFTEKLEKLFSGPPSNFGYKSDIEGIMDELAITKDDLFKMVINSLGRSTRTKPEIRVIASYLFLMQDFLKLLRAKNPEQKENILLKDLLTLAENIDYEKAQNNTVLMRFAEKGSNAFIILQGKVDVLIESYFHTNIGEKTYLYFIANLIKYHEFGLVNSIVNENFMKFPIYIIDDITIKYSNNSGVKTNKYVVDYNFNNNKNDEVINIDDDNNFEISAKKGVRKSMGINLNQINKFLFNNELRRKVKRNNTLRERTPEDNKKSRKKQMGFFKLNYLNEEIRETNNIPQYTAKELLNMFGLQLIDKRFNRELNHVKTDEYVKRLNILREIKSDQLAYKIKKEKEKEKNKIKLNKKHRNFNKSLSNISKTENSYISNNDSEELNDNKSEESSSSKSSYINIINRTILENIKLYSYTKIISLERGSLFGEMALNEPNSLRKATIITSTDCHFAVLNKKTFNNSIKIGAQKHMKETLQFFTEIPIFNGIPESVFYNKYYTNLSKDTIVKGKNIINQGEKPDHITLLQTGSFGLTTQISLYDLTRLILHYADRLINQNNQAKEQPKNNNKNNNKNSKDKKNMNIKKENNKKETTKKKEENISDLKNLNDIQKLLSEESVLLAESIVFKKYYNSLQYIRVAEIYCPEVILNDEYTDEKGLYAFSIEAKSPENIIYTLNNKFLVDFNEKNISIQKNKEKFIKQKMDWMIGRLLIIRNSLINSFFDSKAKKEVGAAVIKELEDMIIMNLRKKRLLNKKEEIIVKTNENEKKEKLNINNIMHKYKNTDIGQHYRNTGDSSHENNYYNHTYNLKTYKINNKIKPLNSHENKKFEYEFKSKVNKSNSKLKLKPINVSLKIAIKYTNHYLDKYKKREKKDNILDKKINEEGLLFSMNDLNNYNDFSKTNYNVNQSRNNTPKFNLLPFSFSSGNKNYDNPQLMSEKTPKVVMNHFIWEKMKTELKFPIKLNIKNMNIINNYENNQTSGRNTINSNYNTYYRYKTFYNRNLNKLRKNKYFSNNNLNNNASLSYDNFYPNMQIENQNNFCVLSSQEKQKNNSYSQKKSFSQSKIEQKAIQSMKNLKRNEALLKLKMKKLVSPEEINLMKINRRINHVMDGNKYNRIKEEKFKYNRKHYYKKTIVNRMNFFYGKTDK